MKINFFEEFPNDKTLKQLKYVCFPSTIYVAAKSLKQFNDIKKKILKINSKVEVAYWVILDKSYWVSPFSYTSELKELYVDLSKNKKPLKILLDLEFPFLNKKLFFINFFSFFKNKKLIKNIFKDQKKLNVQIFTAEYPLFGKILKKLLFWSGLSYSPKKYNHEKIIMYYSSMIKSNFIKNKIKKAIVNELQNNKNIHVGLGTIDKGILETEPILSPNKLEQDLLFFNKNKIKSVVIFRLGGLNKSYINKLKKYSKTNFK